MKKFSRTRSISGFTLIELLVAIAVSGVVLAGLVSVFTTANRSYSLQDEMAAMQQNFRTAKMFLERDIRMAGCGLGVAFFIPGSQAPMVNTNGGSAGSDALTITYVDYDDPCNGALPPLTPTAITPTTITVDIATAPASNAYASWTGGNACSATSFFAVYSRADNSLHPANITSDVFTVAVIPPSTLQCTGLRAGIPSTVPPNSAIKFFSATQLVTAAYSLDSVNRTLIRTLTHPLLPNELATGGAIADDIEDIQFAFGLDTGANGNVDTWIDNADLVSAQQAQIRQVRVSILVRSSRPLPGQPLSLRPKVEDHIGEIGVGERYLRQLYQFEIKPRNIKG